METQTTATFLQQILGTTDLATFAANAFIALVGVLISLLLHANNRDKDGTPVQSQFSWAKLLKENIQRIVLNVLLIYVALRFSKDLTGIELAPVVAFGIGLGFDQIPKLLKRFGLIDKGSSTSLPSDNPAPQKLADDFPGDRPPSGPGGKTNP